jgi:DNA-directed RNA polymerase subunit K
MGAPLLIDTDSIDPLEIADEEFRKQKIPITVKRVA